MAAGTRKKEWTNKARRYSLVSRGGPVDVVEAAVEAEVTVDARADVDMDTTEEMAALDVLAADEDSNTLETDESALEKDEAAEEMAEDTDAEAETEDATLEVEESVMLETAELTALPESEESWARAERARVSSAPKAESLALRTAMAATTGFAESGEGDCKGESGKAQRTALRLI